jgi:hypothetical protein
MRASVQQQLDVHDAEECLAMLSVLRVTAERGTEKR